MKCADCVYLWKNDDEPHARCHFEPLCADDLPPCECEDEYYDEDDYDYGEDEL